MGQIGEKRKLGHKTGGAKINIDSIKLKTLIALIKEIDSETVDAVHVINSLPTELGRNLARYILVKLRNMNKSEFNKERTMNE